MEEKVRAKMNHINLNEKDYLIIPIELKHYYTEGSSFMIPKDVQYNVGEIVKAGELLDQDHVGKIVFYHKNIGVQIKFKKLGKFTIINESAKIALTEIEE